MRNSLRITVLLLAVGLVVLAAGCGGGKKAAADKVGATGGVGATANNGPTGVGPTGGSGAAGGFASAKNCLAFANLAVQIASAMAPASADPANDPDTAARYFKAIADAAPDDIKVDLQTIGTTLSDFVQKAKDAGYDFSSGKTPTMLQITKLAVVAEVFNSKAFTQASQHLNEWEQQNCTMK